jgi:glycosyltransferase involved in cell wall biosynthesis
MRILFLDQSGKLGGAELCLADIAQIFRTTSLVGVFAEGSFPNHLRQLNVPVQILTDHTIQVQKASGLLTGIKSLNQVIPLIASVTQLSKRYDLIYANTQKALVIGAIASLLSGRPLIYHLHDIVSPDHFSATNCRIIVAMANQAALIIANSQASRDAFIAAGGCAERVQVVYNGFRPETYQTTEATYARVRHELGLEGHFVVGHFSRLAPWKGQHVLIEAIAKCPSNVVALLVGDALFGEDDYVAQIKQQVQDLNLQHRVKFLGFRRDIPELMGACNVVAHTSTAPEPFGRVIIEAMLCQRVAIASQAGGAIELLNHGKTGWLCPPNQPQKLAELILNTYRQPEQAMAIATAAQAHASDIFNLGHTNKQLQELLVNMIQKSKTNQSKITQPNTQKKIDKVARY